VSNPVIPDRADQEYPPDEAPGRRQEVSDPEGDHRRDMDKSKLNFAIKLVAGSLVTLVLLEVLEQYVAGISGQSLSGAVDTLKLIATTALGFVFGRTLGKGEN